MNIIFYCQYVWGMGHLIRSIEFVRALGEHDVTLLAGGREVEVDLPGHVHFVRLPVLYMDEAFTTLIPGDPAKSVEQIKQERQEMIHDLFNQKRPDLFIVELYPFGRSMFGFELEPLLEGIHAGRFGAVKCVCSLRDILVEKKNPQVYEERVLQKLNTYFDLVLVHSDANLLRLEETFSRVRNITIPIVYTGFIAQQTHPDSGKKLRQELKISSEEKLIIASAGGGRSGYGLLTSVLDACDLLCDRMPIRLEVFSGPFMEIEEFEKLSARSGPGIRIRRFTNRFLDYLCAADLSISLAGYNTCMNLLVTRTPALVFPYSRQQEQPMRANMIKNFLPMKILNETDVQAAYLSNHIEQMLLQSRPYRSLPIILNGAENTAGYLSAWVKNLSKEEN
jgi:predicted glycosyltransferase